MNMQSSFDRARNAIAQVGEQLGLECFDDCLALLPLELNETTKSGLVLSKLEDINRDSKIGTVIAVGPGKLKDDGSRVPMRCRVGDVVIIAKMLYVYPIGVQGPRVLMTQNEAVMAVVRTMAEPAREQIA